MKISKPDRLSSLASAFYSTSASRSAGSALATEESVASREIPTNLKLCDEKDELKPEVHLRDLVFKEDRIKCVPVRALDDASDEAAVGEVVLDNRVWSLP